MFDYEGYDGPRVVNTFVRGSVGRGVTMNIDPNDVAQFFSAFDIQVHQHPHGDDGNPVFDLWLSLARQYVPAFATASQNAMLYLWNVGQQSGPSVTNPFRSATYFTAFASATLPGNNLPIQTMVCESSVNYQQGYVCYPRKPDSIAPCEDWCAAAGTQQYCLFGLTGVCPCFYNAYGRLPASRAELDTYGNTQGLRGGDGNWHFPIGPTGCGGPAPPPPPPPPPDLHDALGDFNQFCDAARTQIVASLGASWTSVPCSVIQQFIQDHPGIFSSNDPIRIAAQCINGTWRGGVAQPLGVVCGNSTGGGCTGALSCPSGYSCTSGVCTPSATNTGCLSSADCPPNFICAQQVCQYVAPPSTVTCGHSGDCPPGQRCCTGDVCAATCPTPPCTNSSDCPGGGCNNGTCSSSDSSGIVIALAVAGAAIAGIALIDQLTRHRG